MKRYLVVAHSEGDPRAVVRLIRSHMHQGTNRFHVLVPATPATEDYWTWTEDKARLLAGQQLQTVVSAATSYGAKVSGSIGDVSPVDAIEDAQRTAQFDDVLVLGGPESFAASSLGLMSRLKQFADQSFGDRRNALPAA